MVGLASCGESAVLSQPPAEPLQGPAQVDFRYVLLSARKALPISITNPNREPVTAEAVVAEGPFSVSEPTLRIEGESSSTVLVAFEPVGEPGSRRGRMTIGFGGPTLEIALIGEAMKSNAVVLPTRLRFGTLLPGSTQTSPLTVANTTEEPISVTVETTPSAPVTVRPAAVEVEPFGEVELLTTLQTSLAAGPVNGLLRLVTFGRFHDEHLVDVRGSAETAPLDCRGGASLGDITIPSAVEVEFSCTNAAEEPVSVVWSSSGDERWSFDLPQRQTLGSGETVSARARFSAEDTSQPDGQLRQAEVRITPLHPTNRNVVLSSEVLSFAARAGVPEVAVDSSRIDFGRVSLGQTEERSLELFNDGRWPFAARLLTTDNEIQVGDPDLDLEPGGRRTVAILYAPTRAGALEAEILISDAISRQTILRIPVVGLAR